MVASPGPFLSSELPTNESVSQRLAEPHQTSSRARVVARRCDARVERARSRDARGRRRRDAIRARRARLLAAARGGGHRLRPPGRPAAAGRGRRRARDARARASETRGCPARAARRRACRTGRARAFVHGGDHRAAGDRFSARGDPGVPERVSPRRGDADAALPAVPRVLHVSWATQALLAFAQTYLETWQTHHPHVARRALDGRHDHDRSSSLPGSRRGVRRVPKPRGTARTCSGTWSCSRSAACTWTSMSKRFGR